MKSSPRLSSKYVETAFSSPFPSFAAVGMVQTANTVHLHVARGKNRNQSSPVSISLYNVNHESKVASVSTDRKPTDRFSSLENAWKFWTARRDRERPQFSIVHEYHAEITRKGTLSIDVRVCVLSMAWCCLSREYVERQSEGTDRYVRFVSF